MFTLTVFQKYCQDLEYSFRNNFLRVIKLLIKHISIPCRVVSLATPNFGILAGYYVDKNTDWYYYATSECVLMAVVVNKLLIV